MTRNVDQRMTPAVGAIPGRQVGQTAQAGTGDQAVTPPGGQQPTIAGNTALPAQRGATTSMGLPAVQPTAQPAAQVPPYAQTFGGQSYVKDGANPQLLGLMSRAVQADPALAGSALAQGVARGQVGPTEVKALQEYLQGKGYPCGHQGADGKFGPNTHAALAGLLNGQPPATRTRPTRRSSPPTSRNNSSSPAPTATRPRSTTSRPPP
jgi:hypothetical protein